MITLEILEKVRQYQPRSAMVRTVGAKVVLLGASGVGKTSLTIRETESDTDFSERIHPTIGAAMFKLQVFVESANASVQLEVWDTAGQERFHSLTRTYTRNATAAILVFDVTNLYSFTDMTHWNGELDDAVTKVKVLVGNKVDLAETDDHQRTVSFADMEIFAAKIGADCMETSALTGHNVHELFQSIAKLILDKNVGKPISDFKNGVHLDAVEEAEPHHGLKQCCSLR